MHETTIPGVTTLGETQLLDDWIAYNAAGRAGADTVRRLAEGR